MQEVMTIMRGGSEEEASSCATAREMKSGRRTIVYKFDRWNSSFPTVFPPIIAALSYIDKRLSKI